MPVPGAWEFFHQFRWRWGLVVPILLADVAGMLFGWYYYYQVGQFDLGHRACGVGANEYCQPWWTWPLVSDSPNAVLLFFLAALTYRTAGWRHRVLDALAFVANVYVGLWTTTLFLSYPDAMGTFRFGSTNNILFITHMGMPLQSLTLVHAMRNDKWTAAATAWLLAGLAAFVAVDYWGPHLHPAPFLHDGAGDSVLGMAGDGFLAVASPVLMVMAAGAWLAVARPWRKADRAT